jgi:putative AbiEi antitoxin of type IV toxin-antitoxin system
MRLPLPIDFFDSLLNAVRTRDARALGIPPNYLGRLVHKGLLKKVRRGIYASRTFSEPKMPRSSKRRLNSKGCRLPPLRAPLSRSHHPVSA